MCIELLKKAAIKRVNKRPQSPNGFTRLTACKTREKHRWGNCKIEYSRSRWKVRRLETCTSLNDARGGLSRTKKVLTYVVVEESIYYIVSEVLAATQLYKRIIWFG